MRRRTNDVLKWCFDKLLAATALFLLWPLLLVISVLIKLDSPGPVLYRGIRTGRYNRKFNILKFRSMIAESALIPEGTTALNDKRITRVGAFLRKAKLDELPQLINILMGDMSFVGPRPELPRYTDQYSETEKKILTVRPGLTDISSIRFSSLDEWVGGEDADRMFEEKILPVKNRLRLQYVENQTFRSDLKIIFETFITVVKKVIRHMKAGASFATTESKA